MLLSSPASVNIASVGNLFQHYSEEEKVVNCYIICVMQDDGVVNSGDG